MLKFLFSYMYIKEIRSLLYLIYIFTIASCIAYLLLHSKLPRNSGTRKNNKHLLFCEVGIRTGLAGWSRLAVSCEISVKILARAAVI